jgi:pimeloyl-ACP methyl ester carboxylesterase
MDIRGWGGSDDPDFVSGVNVDYRQAAQDINMVFDWVLENENRQQLIYFGWATGGHWGGYFASKHPEKVSHFISLNSLYCVAGGWGLHSAFADTDHPKQFDTTLRGWRKTFKYDLDNAWERSIPAEDKAQWRDPKVVNAYCEMAVAVDVSGFADSIYVPAGYREESFQMANGKQYWSAANLSMPCLVLRGELDFWSRAIDLEAFAADYKGGKDLKTVTILGGTHYLFLDRKAKGRGQLLREISDFVKR